MDSFKRRLKDRLEKSNYKMNLMDADHIFSEWEQLKMSATAMEEDRHSLKIKLIEAKIFLSKVLMRASLAIIGFWCVTGVSMLVFLMNPNNQRLITDLFLSLLIANIVLTLIGTLVVTKYSLDIKTMRSEDKVTEESHHE